ncbi:hypothetical protein AAG570_010591 [Ranatra chinensis]|uniref:Zinc finger Ran-binding domain-containing protein 2 n=1 Tax=Ranatra chinensis TaxID=642074 RepID=A0ABD0YN04_9HEMI
MSDGDWVCSDPHCDKGDSVQKKKLGQEIGKALAEKSRGLFSADDWQCNKCGNVNWARRQQCNMCNAPKFVEVEERTGYGGGYNDRGVVEYIQRDESDSEYDEFGRKKKKRSVSKHDDDQDVNSSKEDEEEDEGDDDDLSKYDLSGWGEESDQQKDKDREGRPTKDGQARLSKSRSRSRSPNER